MNTTNPMDDSPRRRCRATSKRTGARCKRSPSHGRDVCRMHGGATPIGPASPHWTDGRYSKYLHQRMLDRYYEATQDQALLALRSEVALIDSRLTDVLARVDTGESSRVWNALREAVANLEAAQLIGDEVGTRFALSRITKLVNAGASDWAAWADVRQLVQERKALVESERKYVVEAQYTIAVDQAMATMGLLVAAVKRHVTDQEAIRAVVDEWVRLTGVPSPQAVADC